MKIYVVYFPGFILHNCVWVSLTLIIINRNTEANSQYHSGAFWSRPCVQNEHHAGPQVQLTTREHIDIQVPSDHDALEDIHYYMKRF